MRDDSSQLSWRSLHDDEPIRLGVSSCLLGARVRYDGGHKLDRYLTEVMGEWIQWVSVCPEFEIGLGVPRPTIRLVEGGDHPRLIEPESGADLTEKMEIYSNKRVDELQAVGLDGFVLKRASPSCGMGRVKVYTESGTPTETGAGIFARILMEKWPDLPVVEEDGLNDSDLRTRFNENVLCRHNGRTHVRQDL